MRVLFINAAFREDSRTNQLAQHYLTRYKEFEIVDLGANPVKPLDKDSLKRYNKAVAENEYTDSMFEPAIAFADADEIVIAAPFWNFGLPGVLSDYLEIVCSQGVTFAFSGNGVYCSCCKAKKLTFITTAGGMIPAENHAFGYIKSLNDVFWKIPELRYYHAEGLDIYGADVKQLIEAVCKEMDKE